MKNYLLQQSLFSFNHDLATVLIYFKKKLKKKSLIRFKNIIKNFRYSLTK